MRAGLNIDHRQRHRRLKLRLCRSSRLKKAPCVTLEGWIPVLCACAHSATCLVLLASRGCAHVKAQEVVDSLEIEEIPESLLIDMGTLQYRTTLLSMIEKVSTPFGSAVHSLPYHSKSWPAVAM